MRTVALFMTMLVAAFLAGKAGAWADQKATGVRADVLAAVENELARLSKQAKSEKGPVHPRPSSEVAFLLLTGLAAQGTEVKQPTVEEFRQFAVSPSNKVSVQVFTVAEDVRIVISAEAIQDKSGSYTSKRAVFFRRQADKWVERGSGSTATNGVTSSD